MKECSLSECKNLIKKTFSFSKQILSYSFNAVSFFIRLLFIGRLIVEKQPSAKKPFCAVLANGPSIANSLSQITDKEFLTRTEVFVMNFFAESDLFWTIRPSHYCLADPAFFQHSAKEERILNLYTLLEAVTWPIVLYIPYTERKKQKKFYEIKNPKIKIQGVNTIPVETFQCFQYWLYNQGYSMPNVQTVAIMAIYLALQTLPKKLLLYGVDLTFFQNIVINQQNQLCIKSEHFYDDNEHASYIPIIDVVTGKVMKISDYTMAVGKMFASHDALSQYAHYLNVPILNCSSLSLVDSYERNL